MATGFLIPKLPIFHGSHLYMVSGRLNAILGPAYQLTARMCSAQCYSQPSAIFCALIGMPIKFSTWLAKCPSDLLRGLQPGQPIVLAITAVYRKGWLVAVQMLSDREEKCHAYHSKSGILRVSLYRDSGVRQRWQREKWWVKHLNCSTLTNLKYDGRTVDYFCADSLSSHNQLTWPHPQWSCTCCPPTAVQLISMDEYNSWSNSTCTNGHAKCGLVGHWPIKPPRLHCAWRDCLVPLDTFVLRNALHLNLKGSRWLWESVIVVFCNLICYVNLNFQEVYQYSVSCQLTINSASS